MTDGRSTWARYLEGIRRRPGWSVARLARETNLHRSTIFDWVTEKRPASSATLASILAIAEAVGDEPMTALSAAAGLGEGDPELTLILADDALTPAEKETLIDSVLHRRARDRERSIEDTRQMIRLTRGETDEVAS